MWKWLIRHPPANMGTGTDQDRRAFTYRGPGPSDRRFHVSTSALDREIAGLDFVRRLASGEIASVPIGETLNFKLTEVAYGRVAYCESELHDRAGKLLAHATSSCLIFPRST